MKKACSKCGRIHNRNECPLKEKYRSKKITDIDRFRWTNAWKKKAENIKERDFYMCRCCAAGMTYDGKPIYSCNELSVHHIEPLAERFDLRLDDDNLISLCSHHHEEAEKGKIDRRELHRLARVPPYP